MTKESFLLGYKEGYFEALNDLKKILEYYPVMTKERIFKEIDKLRKGKEC